jgi:hypothetical protein
MKFCFLTVTVITDNYCKSGKFDKEEASTNFTHQRFLPIFYLSFSIIKVSTLEYFSFHVYFQSEIFLPGGRTFYNEAVLSAQGIPQVIFNGDLILCVTVYDVFE